MRDNRIFLFFGFGSEYVLNPLYTYMVQMGYKCIEIDMEISRDISKTLTYLKSKDVVVITSAHLFFDKKNFNRVYPFDGEIYSILEIFDILRPVKKIFYPHDLVTPVLKEEIRWLSLFDLILMPLPNYNHLCLFAEMKEVGWIKKIQSKTNSVGNDNSKKKLLVTHAFSSFQYFKNMGFERTYQFWKLIYELNVRIKFPKWPGSTEYEKIFREYGLDVYPSDTNIFDIIEENDVIITNGISSVNFEAALSGKMTINILDGSISSSAQQEALLGIPHLKIYTVEECSKLLKEIFNDQKKVTLGDPILKPFNFELAVSLITS